MRGTPRRLTLIAEGLPERQPDADIEVRGPSKKAAFDEDGSPTKVLEGFVRAQGVRPEEIKFIKTEKGDYVCAVRRIKGEKTGKVLPEVLNGVLSGEIFPKSMRWSSFDISFARPVHWILAVYGGEKINFSFGHIKSSDYTFGHRFMDNGAGKTAQIKAGSVSAYLEGLKKHHVIADPEERKKIISAGLLEAAKGVQGAVLADDGLLEEVTYLVEYPAVLMGSFDREFLELPRDVIINAMREHQRYFSVVDFACNLLPYFLTVANTMARDMDVVRKGNERVLRARLNDAKFYFEKDVKTPLTEFAGRLKGVVFQSKLGTSYEKAERFTGLALHIGERAGFSRPLEPDERPSDFLTPDMNPSDYDPSKIDAGLYSKFVLGRSAMLSKADLVSGVVGEFPKLQGIMGSVYAKRGGEAPLVSTAIYEHYLPNVSGGALPASIPGAIVSIAD
ncbi:MAG: glycine--tRNA ligase subunit beta, partial [Deltaproteobacteria bacterium]|nr:glycine--tRNA ligase subunit beta [Deltaproteobacteria bacterium]